MALLGNYFVPYFPLSSSTLAMYVFSALSPLVPIYNEKICINYGNWQNLNIEILLMLHCQKGMADKLVLNHTMSV